MEKEHAQEIWEQRYEQVRRQGGSRLNYEPWLERWHERFPQQARVLDLGCGSGHDSRWLTAAGQQVFAGDFSFHALHVAIEAGIPAAYLQLDLRDGLPFAPAAFEVVVANLCLHYFPWQQTVSILEQVRGCLVPGGLLLARFNSTRDTNFGAEGSPQIEENAFLVKGLYKRYFDRASLDRLFAGGWEVLHMEEMSVTRYGPPKVLWEVAVEKAVV